MAKPIKVRMHYSKDPKIMDELETRKARAFARALISELRVEQIDELIKTLKERQTWNK
ncbi:hypothetical protein [Clostridium ljungdahlii]|uniref:Uncharacterized protein n=1 Tax=Clostridium ljungdahlii TaxID=1538 RepID=A0A166RLH0_9CLOT|nr:hypothetical protein [Clostridium ljungdahlii]OAA90908.1 hypothetical protein WY13_00974 [Clostridium ljungdahlii]